MRRRKRTPLCQITVLGLVVAALLTGCAHLPVSRGPRVAGACYDAQAQGLGLVSLGNDQLGSAFGPPAKFLYRWTAAGAHQESAALVRRVAVVREWSAQRGQALFGDKRIYLTSAEFPVFDDASAFHRDVSAFLSDTARKFVAENSCEPEWRDWFGLLHTGDFDHYESLAVDLASVEENLVSVEMVEGCFPTRGGSYDIFTYNFLNDHGTARTFALADLFVPGSGWEKLLSDLCLAKLRRGNSGSASLVFDGTITDFSPQDLALFTVSREALCIHFRCFQVTLDGGGESTVDIPWSALREHLRNDGPARFLSAAPR